MSTNSMFGPGDKPISLEFMRFFGMSQSYYQGFRNAADLVVESVPSDDPENDEGMFFAVAYLYRHAIENQLKYILHLCTQLDMVPKAPSCVKGHSIDLLWAEARAALLGNGWEESFLKPLDVYVQEMHTSDPSGQEFRYATTTKNTQSLASLPGEVSFVQLQQAVGVLFAGLDYICEALDFRWEQYLGCA